jgi:hypothetical protein
MKSKYITVGNMEKAIRKSLIGSGFETERDARIKSINEILKSGTGENRQRKVRELKKLFINYINETVENKTTKEMVIFIMKRYTNGFEITDEMYKILNKEELVVSYLEYICDEKVKEISDKLESQFNVIKSCFKEDK